MEEWDETKKMIENPPDPVKGPRCENPEFFAGILANRQIRAEVGIKGLIFPGQPKAFLSWIWERRREIRDEILGILKSDTDMGYRRKRRKGGKT